jgi:hypothetical protein
MNAPMPGTGPSAASDPDAETQAAIPIGGGAEPGEEVGR